MTALLQTSLAVAFLIALVLLVRRPFARRFGAKAAYMLWAIPLARLLLPPLPEGVTLAGLWAGFAPSPGPLATMPAAGGPAPAAVDSAAWTLSAGGAHLSAPPAAPPAPTSAPTELAASGVDWAALALPMLAALLLIGAIAWLARSLYQSWRFGQILTRESQPAGPALQTMSTEIAGKIGLKRKVRVTTSFVSSGPMVTGLLHPTIVLPAWFEEDYTVAEQRLALTHELMHVKRGDLWALQVANLVLASQWFNPLAHRAMAAFRSDQEAACDADVVASATAPSTHDYGSTLVKTVRLAMPETRALPAASLSLNHAIKERLMLLQSPSPSARRRQFAALLTAGAGAAALLATAGTTQAQTPLDGGPDGGAVHAPHDSGDRHLLLLGDPFSDMQHQLKKLEGIGEMDFDFDFDFQMPPMPPMEPMPPMPPMPDFSVMKLLDTPGATVTENGTTVTITAPGRPVIVLDTEAISQRAELIAEHAEAYAARAEAWAERAEAIAERHAAQAEAMAERQAARAEAMAARIEARVERIVDAPEFERAVERGTELVEELDEACREEDFTEGDIAIVEAKVNGTRMRALCIQGKRGSLSPADLSVFIEASPELTNEEREYLKAHRGRRVEIITRHRSFAHPE